MFPPPGAIFDPKTIAVLTAAYDKAIKGQPAALREVIAKRIIELACEGECDIDRLCQGALALSIRDPRSSWSTSNRISGIAGVKTLRP